MGRTQAQQTGQSFRLRTLAAFVLALLFGLQFAPMVQAQTARVPDCCMAAEGRGCSMHLHRAARAGHTFAALRAQCPCTPMAPASVSAHDRLALSASHLAFVLTSGRAAAVPSPSLRGVRVAGSGGTRGPPAMTFAA